MSLRLPSRPLSLGKSLSARLLLLTIVFVMVSEVLIYAPSIGRFRLVYLEERLAAGGSRSWRLKRPPITWSAMSSSANSWRMRMRISSPSAATTT